MTRITTSIFATLLLLCLSLVLSTARAQQEPAAPNMIPNGGFESGAKGWQYHQWQGKDVPGQFDKEDKHEGTQSFKFTDPAGQGGRYMATEVKLPADVEQDYTLTFALKLQDVPEGAARVAVAV